LLVEAAGCLSPRSWNLVKCHEVAPFLKKSTKVIGFMILLKPNEAGVCL